MRSSIVRARERYFSETPQTGRVDHDFGLTAPVEVPDRIGLRGCRRPEASPAAVHNRALLREPDRRLALVGPRPRDVVPVGVAAPQRQDVRKPTERVAFLVRYEPVTL